MAKIHYYYRINGGEVLRASSAAEPPWSADDHFGVFTSDKKLDLSKGYWSNGRQIRAASAAQKGKWADKRTEDETATAKAAAKAHFTADSAIGRALRALRDVAQLSQSAIDQSIDEQLP